MIDKLLIYFEWELATSNVSISSKNLPLQVVVTGRQACGLRLECVGRLLWEKFELAIGSVRKDQGQARTLRVNPGVES